MAGPRFERKRKICINNTTPGLNVDLFSNPVHHIKKPLGKGDSERTFELGSVVTGSKLLSRNMVG